MNTSSYFIKNKGLFGPHPSQDYVDQLNVDCFIDLTMINEKNITKYKTNKRYINYPIKYGNIPTNWKLFASLVISIVRALKNNKKIFISSRKGNGRTSMLITSVLCYYHKITVTKALEIKNKYCKGYSQTKRQTKFLTQFFKPCRFFNLGFEKQLSFFSNKSKHPVKTHLGIFKNVHKAIKEYEKTIKEEKKILKIMGPFPDYVVENKLYELLKNKYVYEALLQKVRNNYHIKNKILTTALNPIVFFTVTDTYWGSAGFNMLGILWEKIRETLYMEHFNFIP